MPLKAFAYNRKKGMLTELNAVQFVRGVCGAKTRAYYLVVQVSDQRGSCLVERPARDGLCL